MRARTLIVSAWAPEIAPIERLLRDRRPGVGAVRLAAVGVGGIDAGIGASRAIADARPTRVIFVGTAGTYGSGRRSLALGAAAVASEIFQLSTAALRGDGYLPEPMVARAAATPTLRAALAARDGAALPCLPVACPTAITRSAPLARALAAASGAALENLEVFAVARAAAAASSPFAAVLGVANRVGPAGHRQWLAHHLEASHAACRAVYDFLMKIG